MRRRNPRFIAAGSGLLVLAAAFFGVMLSMAPQSNDPAELMKIVGGVSGTVGGLAMTLVLLGCIGRKA
jgi:hypothetical protein